MLLPEYTKQLELSLKDTITKAVVHDWDIQIYTTPANLPSVLFFLKNSACSRFTVLSDIVASDHPERNNRFSLVYNLLSVKYGSRLFVNVALEEGAAVPSISNIYPAGNWMEREIWDLLGVFFSDHPDLRRILTDYGFEGHPLRKDFPLTGYLEVRYDNSKSRIVYEPVELAQEYRDFSFDSPWKS